MLSATRTRGWGFRRPCVHRPGGPARDGSRCDVWFLMEGNLDITIDRTSDEPIYRQVVRRIQEMIHSGSLPEGFRLPPERRLAESLGVNRSTVLNAYRELKALGLVDAHVGRGTAVVRPPAAPAETVSVPWRQLFRSSGP